MKTNTLLMATLLIAALSACDTQRDATDTTATGSPDTATSGTTPGSGMPPPATDPSGAVPAEPEALMLLVAVNEHEIAAAEQARSKNVDGPTLQYANLMHTEHSKNLTDTRGLMGASAAADSSPAVVAERQKGEAALAQLAPTGGDEYEKAYIDAMVMGHTDVLAILDTKLIPAAQRPEVRDHLVTTREHVAMHLEKAKELQSSMQR